MDAPQTPFRVVNIRDRQRLGRFLDARPALNAYLLGDLDERYWDNTQWFALEQAGEIREVALLYWGMEPPILIGVPNSSVEAMRACLEQLQEHLPKRVYGHLGQDLWQALDRYQVIGRPEPHHMMELKDPQAHRAFSVEGVFPLQDSDFTEVLELYDEAYPGHWFRREMLGFGPYFGLRDEAGRLAAAGGVHVYSEQYQVATIGNVVTHPEARGRGLATRISARLVRELSQRVATIGLNVHADNPTAIHVYQKLGFALIADYFEMNLVRG